MSRSRIELARSKIIRALKGAGRVLRQRDLATLLNDHRNEWRLPADVSLAPFIRFLIDNAGLKRVQLPLPHRQETMYVVGDVPLLAIALAAKPQGYFSHYTAMGLHELTTQVSKTIYVNVEQRPQPSNPGSLTQESIDRAFRNQQRRTTNFAEYEGHRLMYLNGRFTDRVGVIDRKLDTGDTIQFTDLERTLIDIAIRPAYSGGVAEVAAAYKVAVKRLSVKRLTSLLADMHLVYPYEQAIGFYLQRAGVKESELATLRRKPFRFNFYLAHGMRELSLVNEWRLFVPKGL